MFRPVLGKDRKTQSFFIIRIPTQNFNFSNFKKPIVYFWKKTFVFIILFFFINNSC